LLLPSDFGAEHWAEQFPDFALEPSELHLLDWREIVAKTKMIAERIGLSRMTRGAPSGVPSFSAAYDLF